jgi:hypothetical protein
MSGRIEKGRVKSRMSRSAGCRMKHRALAPTRAEGSRQVWASTEARAVERGDIALVARATGDLHVDDYPSSL